MKAIVVTDQAAGTAGMTLVERPEPPAAINDVIVEVHASGFVPTEMEWPSTWTDRADRDRTPSIPGHELAGVVTALGYGTTGLSVGQRVFGLADWHRDGTLAEYVAIEARNLAPLPGDVDFTVGASLPISGLTAWQGLFEHGRLQAGQSVLAHGAAGAVGTMVTQLAREAGAYVIGTGRAADRQKALDFGAHEFVDLDNDALEDVGGVDLVFDVIGGDIQKRSAGLIRAGGTLVTVVGPPEARPADGLAIDFVVESDRAQLSEIVQRVRDGRLRTNIGNVATLDDAVAALNPTERTQGEDDHPRPGGPGALGGHEERSMSEATEKAILAGGCFWGMQDLIRKRPGVISTRVGYTGGDVAERHLPQPRHPRRGDRDHLRPRADLLPRPARVLLPDPRPDDEEPPGQRHRRELPLGDLLPRRRAASGSPRTRSPTSTPPGCGPARSSPRSSPAGPFWEAEPEHQDYLERYPNGYTCHFLRPDWKLPRRSEAAPPAHGG